MKSLTSFSNTLLLIVWRVFVPSVAGALLPTDFSFAQTQFNGTYTGSATPISTSGPITLTFTVASGVLTGTASGSVGSPVTLSGTVSASGAVMGSGPSCDGSLTVTFIGQITITSSGGATASGTSSQPVCGSGPTSGTWTATRTTTTDVSQFNGLYTASLSGANTIDANHTTVRTIAATVPLTVVNGIVTGIGPAGTVQPISGTVSSSGAITCTMGSCGDTLGNFGSTATFTGIVTITSSGGAKASGTWHAPGGGPDPGGTSPGATCPNDTGSWSATRTAMTGVIAESEIPVAFKLLQSYPNPFNPTTAIEYHVPAEGLVKLSVSDLLGREITLLVNENKSVGQHRFIFDASGLPGGVYFYRMQAGQFQETRKLVLLK